ncbi:MULTISPECIES: cardiolipin synthase [Clostridiaceae]|uniref:Cardiolipin synthase n=1 Tax=Clostridium facile TaxID=2763035 RepID=A0ABR7IQZ4_9CLOT|nr:MULTISPECIES: cardiolipin synthase [Clostridiaceae]MBC5787570.1 cardiolipin synthase [Clostridium facile]PWM99568.1 MAG: cardiolipin synthase [Massilioclostridium sp.]
MKKVWKFLTSRLFVIIALLLLQVALLAFCLYFVSAKYYYYSLLLTAISICLVLLIINKNENPAYKIVWICLIFLFPVAGGIFYLLFRKENTQKHILKQIQKSKYHIEKKLPENQEIFQEIQQKNPVIAKHVHYTTHVTQEPAWKNTQTEYLSPGEVKFKALLEELEQAEQFIFMEYFIIEPGLMWNSVLDILIEKVRQGVEVRLMYDDMGCINTLPPHYDEYLRSQGIQVAVFNPFRAKLNGFMNNRDHRKIAVIDGNVGFTGGINLADEYINEHERFGYWKDASVMIKGPAVNNLTAMFLQLWQYTTGTTNEFSQYQCTRLYETDGYVQPFDDNPLDEELVGEKTYLNIINSAEKYIYLTTPYLVLDNEMLSMLCLAAQNGVDVRIITPHIPDKPYVFAVTRSFYQPLIEAGVKIYEFTPGFIHSKTIVADDQVAIVGTTNFDFRSFYLHFECGIWMYQSKAVHQVYQDYCNTLKQSQEISLEECKKTKWYIRLLRAVLRVFAPLM